MECVWVGCVFLDIIFFLKKNEILGVFYNGGKFYKCRVYKVGIGLFCLEYWVLGLIDRCVVFY